MKVKATACDTVRTFAAASRPASRQASWICDNCTTAKTGRTQATRRVSWQVKGLSTTAAKFNTSRDNELHVDPHAVPSHSGDTQSFGLSAPSLPSQKVKERGELSKRVTRLMNGIWTKASIAGHQINTYTGTDYSGIELLRKKILEQEAKLQAHHETVETRKTEVHDEFVRQANAQKEIVSLLERKSSWLPAELDRYMALVRSAHSHEQSVQLAKNNLEAAETDLAMARSLLEKFERQQYHEEYIWSDTIRRNNTWLTFGLMGVNILLLLAQILVFEPYRRKKIVHDVKEALDQKTTSIGAGDKLGFKSRGGSEAMAGGPQSVVVDVSTQTSPITLGEQLGNSILPLEIESSPQLPEEAVYNFDPTATAEESADDTFVNRSGASADYQAAFWDLFSDRLVQVRQVDMTSLALRGVTFGAALTGLIFTLMHSAR